MLAGEPLLECVWICNPSVFFWVVLTCVLCLFLLLLLQVQRRFNARGLDEEECEVISDYLYHINVDKPSGEYALNALLVPVMKTDHPGVYARRPLAGQMTELPRDLPITFMYGSHDWMFHPDIHTIVSEMSNARLKIIDRAGHNLFMDNPKPFNQELVAALEN